VSLEPGAGHIDGERYKEAIDEIVKSLERK
jgi:hypothetical protein